MTVASEINHNQYVGNGVTTAFDYQFRVFKAAHLLVQTINLDGVLTTLVLNTDYTVTGVGAGGGKVVLTAPLANGWGITIDRDLPIVQETDLRNQGTFYAETHEDAFDYLTMIIQRVYSLFGLALRRPSWLSKFYDALGNRISNLGNPVKDQDATTKFYVDQLNAENMAGWKAGDAALNQKINNNFIRTLRVPESFVEQLPDVSRRRESLLGFNSAGDPVPIFTQTETADLAMKLASENAFAYLGGKRLKIQEANTFMERLISGLPISLYEHVSLVDKKGSGNPKEWDWTEAFKAFRDRILSYQVFATAYGTTYRNPRAHIPAGDYTISEEISFRDLLTSRRVYERTTIIIFGDGPNSSTIRAASPEIALFSLSKISFTLEDVGFIGFGDGLVSNTNKLLVMGTIDGLYPCSQSLIRNVSFKYSNKNILINHAYDCTFDNIRVNGLITGTQSSESSGFEVGAVETDNTNNIRISRMHIEGSYGPFCTGFKTRDPLTEGSKHHTFSVDALHVEMRRFDSINVKLSGLIMSSFRDIHWVSGNGNGGETTIADARRILHLDESSDNKFIGGYITRTGGLYDSVLPPILFEGSNKGNVFSVRIRAGNIITNNISSYVTNNSIDISNLASVFRDCIFHNFDSSVLVNSMLKLTSMASMNRSHYLTVDDNGVLVNSYGAATDGLSKTDIVRTSTSGDFAPKSICVPSAITLTAGSSTTFVLSNPQGNNPNKRGLVTFISKHNTSTGTAQFTTNGTSLLEHINGGLYRISSTSSATSGYVNISLSGGNLLIQNLTSGTVILGVIFMNFMD